LPRLYTDDNFRERVIRSVTDPENVAVLAPGVPRLLEIAALEAAAPNPQQSGTVRRLTELRLILGQSLRSSISNSPWTIAAF